MNLGGARKHPAMIALAGAVLVGAAVLATCDDVPLVGKAAHVDTAAIRVDLKAHGSRLVLALRDGGSIPLALRLKNGAALTPLPLGRPRREGDRIEAPVLLGGESVKSSSRVVVRTLRDDLVRVDLELGEPGAGRALAIEAPIEKRSVFVEGVGDIADVGEASGGILLLGDDPLALGVASANGPVTTQLSAAAHAGAPKILRAFAAPAGEAKTSTLFFALSRRSQSIWGALWAARDRKALPVHGVVGGATERTHVYGLDDTGKTRVRALVDAGGRFALDVPKDVNRWYAAIDEARTSPPLYFEPGVSWDLKLDVSAGGELAVHVRDGDGDAPLVARLAVRGIEGTLDPSFGPDYRASGAGPLMDARTGEATTPLPAGRYRVSATKGIEWSVDAKDVTVEPGGRVKVDLALRHVVPTPGVVGCDLHVHARPSFDTPVLPEDRVLSLVAAGVDFAVPTEHNLVGDYAPSLQALDLTGALAWVPGVEVTTYTPRFGHFGVFPYPQDAGVPPYYRTTPGALFAEAKRDPRRYLQVNHPRLPKDIGYFEKAGFDPEDPKTFSKVRLDFDGLEVYNGFDLEHIERVEQVLVDYYALLETGRRIVATGSSDAHRIQYQWAGYPRTMVRLGTSGDTPPIDVNAVVENIKAGHAIVTSGPILDVAVHPEAGGDPVFPGGEARLRGKGATVEIDVRAAPWIDVTRLELVADGVIAATVPIESRPSVTGPELGTLAEAQARTLRHHASLPLPASARWIMVLARGTRKADDVLAFMPFVPFAFTNPIWIAR